MHAQQKGLMRQLDDSSQGRENGLKCELAAEILRRFSSLRLQVTGHSMLPSVWPGDVLLIKRCPLDKASPGDIVLYAREQRLVVHRVISAATNLGETRLVTQGDASLTPDSPISAAEFLGKVSQIVRAGKSSVPASVLSLPDKLVANVARYSTIAARFLVHRHVTRGNSGKREALC
jgi:signal peptidase I